MTFDWWQMFSVYRTFLFMRVPYVTITNIVLYESDEKFATASDANGKVTAEAALKVYENLDVDIRLPQIPQLAGTGDEKANIEQKIEAPEVLTHEGVVEGIEANFRRMLDNINVEKNNVLRHFIVKKVTDEQSMIQVY